MFWESYDMEFNKLLKDWHDSTAQPRRPGPDGKPRSTGNQLYDSFLDTWGKGNFVDPKVDLSKLSYFAALATASFGPLEECLETLKKMLKTDANGKFTEPPTLKPGVTEDQANDMADRTLESLKKQYHEEADVLEKADCAVKSVIVGSRDPKNPYLQALIRMMDIETNCFKRQAYFLDYGKLDPNNPAP